jgi:peroxiredoxin Q/BCP
MLRVGETAPDFAIGDTTLYKILEKSSAVVFFFPKAFTAGCTRQAGGFGREYTNLRESQCEVIGVSRDTQETNDHFRQSLGLPYSLVGDPGGVISRDYKVRWPFVGLSQRVTFLIGSDRAIRLAFHNEFDADSHAAKACAFATRPR